jgi:hypothetical protein
MREWSTFEGLKNFGTWFKRTRYDSSVWPPGLKTWFRGTTGFEGKLTQQDVCEWLAIASEDDTIADYLYRIKIIESWAEIESIDDARVKNIKESNLLIAIAQGGFLSMRTASGDMRPIFTNDIWIFREVLKGTINPITDRYPSKPVGRGAGPSVRSFLDGIAYAARGASMQDLVVRMDFALGNSTWTEKDITPGSWFDDLLSGYLNDLELYDLSQLAHTVEAYLRRYNKSSISFNVDDLIAIISRDKVVKMFSEPPMPPNISHIGKAVRLHCHGEDLDYEEFIKETLRITLSRWKQIEAGEKPTRPEFQTLDYVLGRPDGFFESNWTTLNAAGDNLRTTRSENEKSPY